MGKNEKVRKLKKQIDLLRAYYLKFSKLAFVCFLNVGSFVV